jgi:hypothetical protein
MQTGSDCLGVTEKKVERSKETFIALLSGRFPTCVCTLSTPNSTGTGDYEISQSTAGSDIPQSLWCASGTKSPIQAGHQLIDAALDGTVHRGND